MDGLASGIFSVVVSDIWVVLSMSYQNQEVLFSAHTEFALSLQEYCPVLPESKHLPILVSMQHLL